MTLRRDGSKQVKVRSPLHLAWPRRAAASANAAMEQLFGFFPDHHPHLLSENELGWVFGLGWPSHLLAHTDPALAECARHSYGLELHELAGYIEVRRCAHADFVFSMFHSRALLAPSLALARCGKLPRQIVHVDAHSDMLPPLLSVTGLAALSNPGYNASCQFDHPHTVMQMIDTGLIHKGSFLAAYLLAVPAGDIFHCWEEITPRSRSLLRTTSEVNIGEQIIVRDTLIPTPEVMSDCWQCHDTICLPEIPPSAASHGIWLDVDLDAFCNRFDGDSDRSDQTGSPNEICQLRDRVAAFLEQLRDVSWRGNIEAISVAASPGFFPSEYWEEVIPTVCDGIAAALVSA